MFKKISLILTTILCCMSCENIIHDTDIIVIKGKELNDFTGASYKYTYLVHKYQYYESGYKYSLDQFFLSNEEYDLGDTLRLTNVTSKKKD